MAKNYVSDAEESVFDGMMPEGTPDNPEITATRRMMLVVRRYRKALDQALKDVGHSQIRWEILYALSMSETDATLMQVAARLGLEGPSIVNTMEKLEKGGFIERRRDPDDLRSRLICLTDKGREAVTIMQQTSTRERAKLLAGINQEEMKVMLHVLTQMRDNLWQQGIKTG
ncbi:MAG: MarR family transcriptional regulator [Sphingobium sp.]|nr:MarR family transcriptional regulator [Sphingobium sp.]